MLIYVSVCVRNRRCLLATPEAHQLMVDAWRTANRWLVGRYIVMPDHVHFFCSPGDHETTLKGWMEYWRWVFTRSWMDASQKPIWQKDFWDTQIRCGESYQAKWQYVRDNALEEALVTDPESWPYQGELNALPWLER
ncbi:MAG: hypothetical protein KDL10_11710 [Kiritimatiellae bacterium]|nr:hypothetical protein [Kiritimatiellia bacterium]